MPSFNYFFYYAAFNAPCVGHKADESQAQVQCDVNEAYFATTDVGRRNSHKLLLEVYCCCC